MSDEQLFQGLDPKQAEFLRRLRQSGPAGWHRGLGLISNAVGVFLAISALLLMVFTHGGTGLLALLLATTSLQRGSIYLKEDRVQCMLAKILKNAVNH